MTGFKPIARAHGRLPVRLRLAQHSGQGLLDGAWWPRDDDLGRQLGLLMMELPPEARPVVRVTYSTADWSPPTSTMLVVDDFAISVQRFARRDTHLVVLRALSRRTTTLLVVPPLFSVQQGQAAMLAAMTFRNAYAARGLLRVVTEQNPNNEGRRWTT